MAQSSKPRGRPGRPLAPRINATAEEVARYVLNRRPLAPEALVEEEYRCRKCNRPVYFPEILHDDGQCEECHKDVLL